MILLVEFLYYKSMEIVVLCIGTLWVLGILFLIHSTNSTICNNIHNILAEFIFKFYEIFSFSQYAALVHKLIITKRDGYYYKMINNSKARLPADTLLLPLLPPMI